MQNKPEHIFILFFSFLFLIFSFNALGKILPSSPFIIADMDIQKACSEFGCLEISGKNEVSFHSNKFLVQANIRGIENLFILKEKIGKLQGVITAEGSEPSSVKIVPDYSRFINLDENYRRVTTYIEAPLQCFVGEGKYNLRIYNNNNMAGQMQFRVIDNDSFPYSALLKGGNLYLYKYINSIALLISALLLFVSYFIECRFSRSESHETPFYSMLARYVLLCLVCLVGFLNVKNGIGHFFWLLVIFLISMPWGLIPGVRKRIFEIFQALVNFLIDNGKIETKSDQKDNRGIFRDKSPLWVALSILTLIIFIYAILHDSTFLWGMFEERDFLRALDVSNFKYFPTTGPELLQGGQTPGGFLYIFLAPFAKLSVGPYAFAILNKLLFIFSAIFLWWILNIYVKRIPALVGMMLFCSSYVIAGFAYWPIHPSMSVAFYLLFIFLVLKGLVDGSRIAVILSGFVLSILVQFHFSYYLVLVGYFCCILALRKTASINIRTYLFAALAFLIPFIPYLTDELVRGFPNARLILEQNRAHPSYSGIGQIGDPRIVDVLFKWFYSYGVSGYLNAIRLVFMLTSLFLVSILVMKNSGMQIGRGRYLFLKIICMLCFVPLFILFIINMGYNYRHTISYAPSLFILTAAGFGCLIQMGLKIRATLLALFMTLLILLWVPSSDMTYSIANEQSEWAVDFKMREKVLNLIASDFGIDEKVYATKTCWHWMAWAEDPILYKERLKKVGRNKIPGMGEIENPGTFLFILGDQKKMILKEGTRIVIPTLFAHHFTMVSLPSFSGMPIFYRAQLNHFKGASPSGNSDSHTQLDSVEKALEFLRFREKGLFPVRFGDKTGNQNGICYILSLEKGRIKVLISLKQEYLDNKAILRWEMNSSSLNGYYQEIKTIWRPYIMFRDASTGESHFGYMLDDVVGSLIYKTTLNGIIEIPRGKMDWQISIGVKGWFDQSSMREPILEDVRWEIDESNKQRVLDLRF